MHIIFITDMHYVQCNKPTTLQTMDHSHNTVAKIRPVSVAQLGLLCYRMYYVEKCPFHAQNKYTMAIHCITEAAVHRVRQKVKQQQIILMDMWKK